MFFVHHVNYTLIYMVYKKHLFETKTHYEYITNELQVLNYSSICRFSDLWSDQIQLLSSKLSQTRSLKHLPTKINTGDIPFEIPFKSKKATCHPFISCLSDSSLGSADTVLNRGNVPKCSRNHRHLARGSQNSHCCN